MYIPPCISIDLCKCHILSALIVVRRHVESEVYIILLFLAAKEPPKPRCKSRVDVGFLLDSSGSLANDYNKEKDFLKALAATFGMESNGGRAGVITFSFDAEHSIKMSDHDNLFTFNDAVDKIPLMASTTRIDKALRLAQKEMFALSSGSRSGVKKMLILLTDGSQTNDIGAESPSKIANEIRQTGISTVVIGIGSGIDKSELLRIAGSKDLVFNADSFAELISVPFVNQVSDTSCEIGE